MSIFTNIDIAILQGEAHRHNSSVLASDLQPYNDLLFDIISKEVSAKKAELMESLNSQINNHPVRLTRVCVPIWSYNSRIYTKSRETYNEEVRNMTYMQRVDADRQEKEQNRICEENGWHWTIGVESAVQWLDEPTNWKLQPVPVNLVIRKTDLLWRLSLMFARDVLIEHVYKGRVYSCKNYLIEKYELRATFFLNGFSRHAKKLRENVSKKYSAGYEPYRPDTTFGPTASDSVVLTGPGREPPKTPPTTAVSTPMVPNAPRRMRYESCEYCYDSE